ncbi:MAG: caspase family protein [Nitrospirae bacterium]|nr:caspase family protein [Nitrospirota bacterium]
MRTYVIFVLFLTLTLPGCALFSGAGRDKDAAEQETPTETAADAAANIDADTPAPAVVPVEDKIPSKTLKGHLKPVYSVAFSPDSRTVASIGADRNIILWNAATGEQIKTYTIPQVAFSGAFSPDGKIFAFGGRDRNVILGNAVTGEKIKTLTGHTHIVFSVAFSPDGKTLASGSADRSIILWNTATGQKIKTLSGHTNIVTSLTFSPDGRFLASGSRDRTVILWDFAKGENVRTFKDHTHIVDSVAFSPDGKLLASSSADRTIIIRSADTGEKVSALGEVKNIVNAIAFSPGGKFLAAGGWDRTVALWDVSTGKKIKTLTGHEAVVSTIAFSRDGTFIASAGEDRNVIIWDVSSVTEGEGSLVAEAKPETKPAQRPSPEKDIPTKMPVVAAPELFYEVKIEDTNGNGIFEGGETITVTVNIENKGKGAAQGVEILLSGNNTLITCLGNKSAVGNMEPGSKKKTPLKCTLPTRIKPETAQLTVELNEQRGYSPAEIKSFTAALKPAEIKETTQELSRLVDVDIVPSKIGGYKRENSYAVIVGISRYRDEIIPGVKYAEADAQMIAKYLENVGGVPKQNIKVLTNEKGTLGDLSSYFEEWLPKRVKKDSNVFIYYAGHGSPDTENNEAYLVPYDGHPDFKSRLYPLKRMYEALNKLPAEQVVVMLDSCFSGAGDRSVTKQGSRPISISIENPVLAGGKVSVLAASTGTQISSDYDKVKHGLFTYYLLKGMKGEADSDKNNVVALGELYDYLKENVPRTASIELNRDQTPVLLPDLAGDGHGNLEINRVK